MEILPSSSGSPIADLLRGVLAELDATVDKGVIEPFTINADDEAADNAAAMIADKNAIAYVEGKLKPFSDLAFKIHRTITGKSNEFKSYPQARLNVRDTANVDWCERKAAVVAAEEQRLRAIAKHEDEARRAEEAKELERRGRKEHRPDLIDRAEQLRREPVRDVAYSGRASAMPHKFKTEGGTVGVKEGYVVDVLSADDLINAIGAPLVLRASAVLLEAEFGKKKAKPFVDFLRAHASSLPQIPTSVVDVNEKQIKKNAEATNGRINWPGVAIGTTKKSTARRA